MKRIICSLGLFLICMICSFGITPQYLNLQKDIFRKDQIYSDEGKVYFQSNQDILKKYNSTILNVETYKTDKKSIYIRIPNRLTKVQLEEIAVYLRTVNQIYDRLFIFYLLPNMEEGSGAWATTHYNKDLEIKIFGADKPAQEKMTKVIVPSEEIVGKWYDNTPSIEHSLIIYKVDGKYKLKRTFVDGSVDEKDLQFSMYNGKSKYVYKNDSGEYLLIEKDGRLSYYDEYGLINT